MHKDHWELPEPWITKQQLAGHLSVTQRWIELQQHLGLPYLRMGGINRYRLSEVEAWIREQYNSSADSPKPRPRCIAVSTYRKRANFRPCSPTHTPFASFRGF